MTCLGTEQQGSKCLKMAGEKESIVHFAIQHRGNLTCSRESRGYVLKMYKNVLKTYKKTYF